MQRVGKGKFKRGQVKRTSGQRKLHVSQMSDMDKHIIINRVQGLNKLYATKHVIDKIKYDNLWFTSDMVIDVINQITDENIIEYNISQFYGETESRVLLRSTESYPVKIAGKGTILCNLCFVLSLDRGALVTVY